MDRKAAGARAYAAAASSSRTEDHSIPLEARQIGSALLLEQTQVRPLLCPPTFREPCWLHSSKRLADAGEEADALSLADRAQGPWERCDRGTEACVC